MSFRFKNLHLYSEDFATEKLDEAIQNGILHGFKHMVRNKHRKVLRAIQLVVLMKILCSSKNLVCSNRHSNMKSLHVNDVADYNLGFLLLLILYLLVSLVLYRHLKMLRV